MGVKLHVNACECRLQLYGACSERIVRAGIKTHQSRMPSLQALPRVSV